MRERAEKSPCLRASGLPTRVGNDGKPGTEAGPLPFLFRLFNGDDLERTQRDGSVYSHRHDADRIARAALDDAVGVAR